MMNGIPKSVQSADQNAGGTHPQPSQYYCEECKRSFVRPAELRRHLKQTIRHNPNGARIFACDKCPRKFTHSYNLKTHQKLHSSSPDRCGLPFSECHEGICTHEFSGVSNFRAHLRQQHLGKSKTPPAWLARAIERRLLELKTKSIRRRRPIVERNPGDFIHETFDASVSSGSSSLSQLTQVRVVGDFISFVRPSLPQSTEVCGMNGSKFFVRSSIPQMTEAHAASGSSSFVEPSPLRLTEAHAMSGSSFFVGSSIPQLTEAHTVSGSSSFDRPFPPPLDFSTPLSFESVIAGCSPTQSQVEELWKMCDLDSSQRYNEDTYPEVPALRNVEQVFREPLVFPHIDMNSYVAREPFASAEEQFFYDLNRPMTCSFTDLLNDAEPHQYDTSTTLPFSYNESHDGAGWIG